MQAYHNDPAIKAKYEARFAAHREADEVIQGRGFENGRGCFVGCTLDDYKHSKFVTELGWPEWLAHLADKIFEGLPKAEAPQFGTDLLAAVKVGTNLDAVRVPFLVAVQRRNLARLGGNAEPYALKCREAIQGVIDYLLGGEQEAAWSAAEAARSAARSAAEAAWSAAWSAAEAAWSAAAWSAESQTQRNDLLAIIKELPNV